MKRSEMIDKIEILLENIGYKGPSNSGELVVELIEKEGMLPPSREYFYMEQDFPPPATPNLKMREGRGWEDEDEKK